MAHGCGNEGAAGDDKNRTPEALWSFGRWRHHEGVSEATTTMKEARACSGDDAQWKWK